MQKQIIYNEEALLKLSAGVTKLSKVIKSTFGPGGRNVLFEKDGQIVLTKDGVTVANQIELEDGFENEGAQLVKEVCRKTDKQVGDGTTTSAILSEVLLQWGIKYITAGADPREFIEGMSVASAEVKKALISQAQKANKKDAEQIATIASNNDNALGALIAGLFSGSAAEVILLKTHRGNTDEVEIVDGLEIPSGLLSHHFFYDKDQWEINYTNPYILLTTDSINELHSILPVLNKIADSRRPLCIISPEVSNEVLSTLITNFQSNALPIVAIKAPTTGANQTQWLEDIALLTDTEVFARTKGDDLTRIQLSQLGQAAEVICYAEKTIFKGLGENRQRLTTINTLINDLSTLAINDPQKQEIENHLGRLRGQMKILHISAPSESELSEKKHRAEDAINAVKGALQEGVVSGGGVAYLQCLKTLKSLCNDPSKSKAFCQGVNSVMEAIKAPFIQIVSNTGDEPLVWLEIVLSVEEGFGYNARTRQLENLRKAGVKDSLKTLRLALDNAVSVSTMILQTRCVIIEKEINNY